MATKKKQRTFRVSAKDFADVFGRYECPNCGKLFTPPRDRPIITHAKGSIWETCKCGGRFKRREEDSHMARFRGDMTFEENKASRNLKGSRAFVEQNKINKKTSIKETKTVEASRQFTKFASEEYMKNYPKLLKERDESLSETAREFLQKNEGNLGLRRVSGYALTSALSKSIVPYGIKPKKISSYDLSMANDFYWEQINKFLALDSNLKVLPTIVQFCSMIGLGRRTFGNYCNSQDQDMKDVCDSIKDRFKDFYVVHAMTGEIKEIMSIFYLKAEHQMKDKPDDTRIIHEHKIIIDENSITATKDRLGISGSDLADIDMDESES